MLNHFQARASGRGVVAIILLSAGLGTAICGAYIGGLNAGMSSSRNEATLIGSSSTGSDPIADSAFGAISSETEKTAAGMKRSPAQTFARELNCLTQAVYFEARGESPAGQAAVAQVVLNRVRKAGFPKSVCGVVFQGSARGAGCQFSFACDGSMRQAREARSWSQARHIAARALAGAVMTAVGDATHFHTVHVSPDWSRDLREVTHVGLHIFYRIGRTSDGEILADAPGDPILADVRGADARLVSGPAGDPIEVVEAPPPPSPPAVVSTADPGEAHAPAA